MLCHRGRKHNHFSVCRQIVKFTVMLKIKLSVRRKTAKKQGMSKLLPCTICCNYFSITVCGEISCKSHSWWMQQVKESESFRCLTQMMTINIIYVFVHCVGGYFYFQHHTITFFSRQYFHFFLFIHMLLSQNKSQLECYVKTTCLLFWIHLQLIYFCVNAQLQREPRGNG